MKQVETKIQCPTCKGTKVQRVVARMLDAKGWHNEPPVPMDCSLCKGAGEITQEYLDALKAANEAFWCQCGGNALKNSTYYEDDENSDLCCKHHYRCNNCGKVTQTG